MLNASQPRHRALERKHGLAQDLLDDGRVRRRAGGLTLVGRRIASVV
jgi:hypothetical protein